jgi:hypothetical protein
VRRQEQEAVIVTAANERSINGTDAHPRSGLKRVASSLVSPLRISVSVAVICAISSSPGRLTRRGFADDAPRLRRHEDHVDVDTRSSPSSDRPRVSRPDSDSQIRVGRRGTARSPTTLACSRARATARCAPSPARERRYPKARSTSHVRQRVDHCAGEAQTGHESLAHRSWQSRLGQGPSICSVPLRAVPQALHTGTWGVPSPGMTSGRLSACQSQTRML